MKTSRQAWLGLILLLGALAAGVQAAPTSPTAESGTVPLTRLIAAVARKTGRKFVLYPQVQAQVTLIGEDPSSVTYDELLTILDTYGFAAVQSGDYVQVVPKADIRAEALPLISANEKLPADEYVTAVFRVRSIPAGWLVPILRPLVPRSGHLVAMVCDNSLVIVDRFANVRRLEGIVAALDTGAPIKLPRCIVPMPRPWLARGAPPTQAHRRPAP
jgi:general secretion pathway protein D